MSLSRNILVSFLVIFLASCAQLESITNSGRSTMSSDDMFAQEEPTQEDLRNQFQDIPFPNDTSLNLLESSVKGSGENWFGDLIFDSKLNAEDVFMHFKEYMPDTGWFLINEMQGKKILLIYEKDLRTAAISVDRKRSGSEVFIAVAPRDQ
jgi:hypothetical protein